MPFVNLALAIAVIVLVALIRGYISSSSSFNTSSLQVSGDVRRILSLVLDLIIVGTVLWIINTYIPMAHSIKALLNIVVVIAACVYVLKVAGIWDEIVRMWDNLKFRATH